VPKTSLLIVEDYEPIVTLLQSTLSDEFHVMVADSVERASLLIERETPRLVLLDLGLPPKSSPEQGFRLLHSIQRSGGRCKTIVCTGYSERDLAVRAVRYGAFDVLYKPIDLSILRAILRRAGWLAELEQEARQDGLDPVQASDHIEEIMGTSSSMAPIQEAVRQAAMTDVPILIIGETGTGKEFIARAIHERSRRASAPFVPLACGVVPHALFEAELFGDGSVCDSPGAHGKEGKLESAKHGTLFLDDVADVPAESQETILRVLEQQSKEADVRIVASSKHDPKAAMEEQRFQSELYQRFPVHITLPPLRERGEDVSVLAKMFLRRLAGQHSKSIIGFTKDALDAMRAHAWPDNVRELAGRVQRAVVVAEGEYIEPSDLDLQKSEQGVQEDSISLKVNQQRIETDLIMKAFTLSRGNLSRAAQELGISRSTLYRRIRQYGLDRTADVAVS
jgi:two-component system NtrC family response regulator